MGGRRLVVSAVAAVVGLLVVASAAQASFHEIKVREVYPGTNNDSYIELQMFQPGQTFVGGHSMTVYNSDGTLAHASTFGSLPSGLPNGANQATILIGDSNTQTTFGVAPNLVDSGLSISAAGGAVCWNAGGIPADCVSWGNFTGDAMLQSSAGTSAGTPVSSTGITTGNAIRRSIAPNCSTFLDDADDTNSSATDFSEVSPPLTPRNNASAITETACVAPNTTINSATHVNGSKTNDTANSFTFSASPQSGSTSFECKLDAGAFTACTSPQQYSSLNGDSSVSGTSHTFQVRAIDTNGTDPSPATLQWTVDTVAPTISIVNHPPNPSSPNASFTFQANESVNSSSYQCSLVSSGSADSFSSCLSTGKSYSGLADGSYTFKVRATDSAGNQSSPPSSSSLSSGTYIWAVDHLAADKTPPNTFIDTKPPDPSDSSSASFTYHADEAATFECKLDSAPFTTCDPGGITYTGLQNGSHAFQVRATDPSNNVDATPAGYTFTAALPIGTPPPPPDPTNPPPLLPPQTTINLKPPAKTHDRTPTFRFRSSEAESTFRCKVDGGTFKACRSPFTTKTLTFGRHTLKIQAVSGGIVDPTPATFSFKVVKH